MCVCVCVWERERQRERKRVCVCVCYEVAWDRGRFNDNAETMIFFKTIWFENRLVGLSIVISRYLAQAILYFHHQLVKWLYARSFNWMQSTTTLMISFALLLSDSRPEKTKTEGQKNIIFWGLYFGTTVLKRYVGK